MCGLAGALVFAESDFRIDGPWLTVMRDTMIHRGPDGGANWIAEDGRIGLAHRRLSIIDLSAAANQPMANEDGALRVVFNGEIYNHAEIRTELKRLGGHTWATDHSDTEVILHAYEQWGIDCLHRFRGMFAFALWDGRTRQLWLVRDRFGVKPLYWSRHHGRITFASEIKALLTDAQQERAVNEESLFHYLSFLCTPAPHTLFKGISKIPAGCLLRVTPDGAVEERRWYEPWDHVQPLTGLTDAAIAERVRGELRTAVALRGVSDVPVGVFLSGGIDSSTNAALFAETSRDPIHTFSIGYDGDYRTYKSELPFARLMAERIGAIHHERLLNQDDLIGFLPRMVWLQDEPIADPVCVPVHFVSELARKHGVIVCQVGEGADELFCGYPDWKRSLGLQRWADLPLARLGCAATLAGARLLGRGKGLPQEWLRRGAAGLPVFWSGAESFTNAEKHALLHPSLRSRFHGRTSWEAIAPLHRRFLDKAWEKSALNWMTFSDLNLRLPELLLMRLDKMCMGNSLEGREPFLDHKLVELALSIPTAAKTRGGVLKTVLKQAVRGTIPDQLIDRPKQGFGVPVHEWLMDRLGQQARVDIAAFCESTNLLDAGAAQDLFDRGSHQSWFLLNLARWHSRFIRGET